ncbi:MAG: hypothetical protein DCC67_02655 [Planctomycetota bacterium]|nr:MAG: hypothetical protein DCC67_02655 [Planctomycetota bacterium]
MQKRTAYYSAVRRRSRRRPPCPRRTRWPRRWRDPPSPRPIEDSPHTRTRPAPARAPSVRKATGCPIRPASRRRWRRRTPRCGW